MTYYVIAVHGAGKTEDRILLSDALHVLFSLRTEEKIDLEAEAVPCYLPKGV